MKIKGIEFVRAVACLMILIHHLSATFSFTFIDSSGRYGVMLFIVISGFLSGYNKEASHYNLWDSICNCLKKLKKFYLIYLICFFFGVLLLVVNMIQDGVALAEYVELIKKSIAYLLMIQVWIPQEEFIFAINGPCWYLSMIMFVYFCEPFVIYVLTNRKNAFVLLGGATLTLILLTIAIQRFGINDYYLYFFPITRCLEFCVAAGVGRIYKDVKIPKEYDKVFSIVEVGSLVLAMLFAVADINILWQKSIGYLPISILLVIVFVNSKGVISKIMEKKLFSRFAELSFVLFMIHQLVYTYMHVLNKYIFRTNDFIIAIASLVLAIICADIIDKCKKRLEEGI